FFSATAKAGILLEPYVGYQSLLTTVNLGGAASGLSFKLDGSGAAFGARVGATISKVFIALDYSTGTLATAVKDLPAGVSFADGNQTRTSIGATAGVDLMLIRPYLGYIFDDQFKGADTLVGTGFKVGLGFSVAPKVRLNLEYHTASSTKLKDSDGSEITFSDSALFKSVTTSGFFAGISLPFDL
ncbi:MAG: hypothetical protein K2X47_08005, partial [Bdellovibrionales bacterium]|nr:hypothetical protein [Bdellovibrionales bacterium]